MAATLQSTAARRRGRGRPISRLGLAGLALGATLGLAGPPAAALAQERAFKVIVNAANPVNEIKKDQVATLFLSRQARWKHGNAQPVDQSLRSPLRAAFAADVLGKTVQALQAYWERRLLIEKEPPPPVKSSDAEVIAFVAKSEGGVGYVAAATELPPAVRELKLIE